MRGEEKNKGMLRVLPQTVVPLCELFSVVSGLRLNVLSPGNRVRGGEKWNVAGLTTN